MSTNTKTAAVKAAPAKKTTAAVKKTTANKTSAPKKGMVKGKTTTGFPFEVKENVGDDFELLDDLIELNKGNMLVLRRVLNKVLGEDQTKALMEHCRGEDGIVHTSAVSDEVIRIFRTINALKK